MSGKCRREDCDNEAADGWIFCSLACQEADKPRQTAAYDWQDGQNRAIDNARLQVIEGGAQLAAVADVDGASPAACQAWAEAVTKVAVKRPSNGPKGDVTESK